MKLTSVFQLLVVMVTLYLSSVQKVEAKPNSEEITNVMEAIKFLDNLEKYYNEKSRPRFGRSVKASDYNQNKAFIGDF